MIEVVDLDENLYDGLGVIFYWLFDLFGFCCWIVLVVVGLVEDVVDVGMVELLVEFMCLFVECVVWLCGIDV